MAKKENNLMRENTVKRRRKDDNGREKSGQVIECHVIEVKVKFQTFGPLET